MKSTEILSNLRGGDRRSIGNVGKVVGAVQKKPGLFKNLVSGLFDDEPVVRMRAADAMEKISRENPELLQPVKETLIALAQRTRQQELRWHVAQMIPRVKLTSAETARVTDIFFEYLKDKSKIVVTFAMQALSDLAMRENAVPTRLISAIEKLARSDSPAVRSRGKKLLLQLAKKNKVVPLEVTKMKDAKNADQWVWVVVQDPGGQEQFLGQHDNLEDISYIPAFRSKEEAQQCFMNMALRKNCKYEVQAILMEVLAKDAAANEFMIFLLNENGKILEKIKP